jgi:competence protein ComEA
LAGAGVRAVGVQRFAGEAAAAAPGSPTSSAGDRVLAAQLAAVDSLREQRKGGGATRRSGKRPSRSTRAKPTLPNGPVNAPQAMAPLIDVNSAPADSLEQLPRVGPALARRIVAWREAHGPFADPEALRHVRGIGPATVRLLAPRVTFSGRHRPLLSVDPPHFTPFD